MTKLEIRAAMRIRRKSVSPSARAEASARICERLLAAFPAHAARAPRIAVYIALPDEIDLAPFIRTCGFPLAAPRWNGRAYELADLKGCWPDAMVAGPHGVCEPPNDAPAVEAEDVDAWIVPALAFSKDGVRLGYGGGWYDRMMAHARAGARRIGVGYRFQVVETLPAELHDIRIDEVVTD